MTSYHNPRLPGNWELAPAASLPLFAWAATAAHCNSSRIPIAVRRIAAKARVSFHHAAVIATLAGIPSEVHHD